MTPQSAGINVQSPQSEPTPRRLTLNKLLSTVYRLDSKTLATLSFGTFDSFPAVWAKIDCTVHVALPK